MRHEFPPDNSRWEEHEPNHQSSPTEQLPFESNHRDEFELREADYLHAVEGFEEARAELAKDPTNHQLLEQHQLAKLTLEEYREALRHFMDSIEKEAWELEHRRRGLQEAIEALEDSLRRAKEVLGQFEQKELGSPRSPTHSQ